MQPAGMFKPLLEYMEGKTRLDEFSEEDLKSFPLEYLVMHAQPVELLYAWPKLTREHCHCWFLQTALPCFVHYNRPDSFHHIDGPPSSQSNCRGCRVAFA